jgi:YidC/Oxa1 family membrane protein insertase
VWRPRRLRRRPPPRDPLAPTSPRPRPDRPTRPRLRSALHTAAQALYTLADGDVVSGAAAAAGDAALNAAAAAGDAAATAAAAAPKDGGGVFGFLAEGFEAFLEVLDGALEAAHVPYSYGYAIILLTLMVKLATFPLSQKSVSRGFGLVQALGGLLCYRQLLCYNGCR